MEKNIDEYNLMMKRLENDEDLAIQIQEQEIIEDYNYVKQKKLKELESDNEPKRKSGGSRRRRGKRGKK